MVGQVVFALFGIREATTTCFIRGAPAIISCLLRLTSHMNKALNMDAMVVLNRKR